MKAGSYDIPYGDPISQDEHFAHYEIFDDMGLEDVSKLVGNVLDFYGVKYKIFGDGSAEALVLEK